MNVAKRTFDERYFLHNPGTTMRYWWVNQNQTYKAEVPGGFLWSPKTRADGARNQFYENMREVEPGDVIFSFCDTYIKAVGIVTAAAETAPKPDFGQAGTSWSNEGWLVPVEFRVLKKPFRPKDNINALRPHLPNKYSPLQDNGDGLQSVYLAAVPEPMAEQLTILVGEPFDNLLSELIGEIAPTEISETAAAEAIMGRTDIGATTKAQLVKSRRGQGVFKANVRLNETSCRVTGVMDPKHLRASHIKPWRVSTDEEKLHGCNGLLLSPHIDHLFDSGFVSFADNGDLLTSPQLDESVLKVWGIDPSKNVGEFNSKQATFLNYHRAFVFKGEKATASLDVTILASPGET